MVVSVGKGGKCSCPGGLTARASRAGEDDTAAVASRGRLRNLQRVSRDVSGSDNGYGYDVVSCHVVWCTCLHASSVSLL